MGVGTSGTWKRVESADMAEDVELRVRGRHPMRSGTGWA